MGKKKTASVNVGASTSTSNAQTGTISIDIGLQQLKADQANADFKSIESDSSDTLSSDFGVDQAFETESMLTGFSQRQRNKKGAKGPKAF